ncbi:hypothetical protein [Roseisalinus antarcticus]|uniref:Sulfotransferase family protein n=1 Tax=Roseisalinus antarcticus TaxID=254357 RepID=A0A1Y5U1R1_9RHOB|nr:hypothetical protein [Roseisalinus antarcticus]SLN77966.1 hypothetical protein ROA7023_04612 [Roseisalinus antarcticus]
MVLHVGAHKTATTHFQQALRRGRRGFERAGATLYTPLELRHGPKLPERLGISYKLRKLRDSWSPGLLSEMAEGRPRLVISEENVMGQMSGASGQHAASLYPEAEARVATLAMGVAPLPLTLFLTIREPASYLVSAYSQSLLGGFGKGFERFVARIPPHAVDWCDLVRRLLTVPRVGEVVVWRKEDYPEVAFQAADGLAGARIARPFWFSHKPLHEGLSAPAAAAALEAPVGKARATAAEAARKRFPISAGHPRLRPFDGELEALAAEYYAAQWQRLAAMPRVRLIRP